MLDSAMYSKDSLPKLTRGLFAVPCLFALWVASVSLVRAEDWPQWRGPRSDGSWRAPQLPERWPEAGPRVVWRRPIGGGYSGIAVVGNRVYTQDRPKEPADRERIWCGDLSTGETIWTYDYAAPYGMLDYGKGPRGTPTLHDGRIYTVGAVGHVHCLDAASGKLLWSHDLVGKQGAKLPTWGFSCSPVVHGDLVIVHAGLPKGCYVAYDRRSGEERWRGDDDPLGYGTPILIAHAGRTMLVGWTPEHILALDPDTGTVHWKVPYKVTYGVSIATPIARDGIVLVAGYWEGAKAIQVGTQPTDAKLLWEENRYLRGLMSQPLYRDGHVYLLEKQHGLVCAELATGKVLWTDKNQLTPRDRNPQANLVWLGDTNRIIALNASGELILASLSPAGYEERSRTKFIGETWAHPAFADRFIIARDDQEIVCGELAPVAK